jgi:hypothetical protein
MKTIGSDFVTALKNGATIKVVFIKKDGSERTLIGTTNLKNIPKVDHPHTNRTPARGVQRIYDLEIGEWRSVSVDAIQMWQKTEFEVA